MKSTGKIIYEVRMKKGISQEELAAMAKVNLRTIQRIENDLTAPRDTTINLICGVLKIEQHELKPAPLEKSSVSLAQKLINVAFIALLNIFIASVIIYLTVYEIANTYTRIGAFVIAISFTSLVVLLTRTDTAANRLVKFGAGFILLIVFLLFQVKIELAIFSGAIPCALIALSILCYGNSILLKNNIS